MHDFTALPSTTTVQAPQLPVSQPMCVPVRLRVVADEVHEQPPGLDQSLEALAVYLELDQLLLDRFGAHVSALSAAASMARRVTTSARWRR